MMNGYAAKVAYHIPVCTSSWLFHITVLMWVCVTSWWYCTDVSVSPLHGYSISLYWCECVSPLHGYSISLYWCECVSPLHGYSISLYWCECVSPLHGYSISLYWCECVSPLHGYSISLSLSLYWCECVPPLRDYSISLSLSLYWCECVPPVDGEVLVSVSYSIVSLLSFPAVVAVGLNLKHSILSNNYVHAVDCRVLQEVVQAHSAQQTFSP